MGFTFLGLINLGRNNNNNNNIFSFFCSNRRITCEGHFCFLTISSFDDSYSLNKEISTDAFELIAGYIKVDDDKVLLSNLVRAGRGLSSAMMRSHSASLSSGNKSGM